MDKPGILEDAYARIIEEIDDLSRPGVAQTPQRAADAIRYLTRGYTQQISDIVNDALFETASREMIVIQDIELYSLCEHHLLPFIGRCHVGYIPNGKVLGLSKIARLVDMFARRLQIQEALTMQIADALCKVTDAEDVGVIIEAKHLCMMMRGVEKQNSRMTTSAMLGAFRSNASTRSEFLSFLK